MKLAIPDMNPTQLLKHFDCISEVPDAVPRLRRFILDLAVRGKLVEQDPNDEPASELIKRIRAEREKLGLTPRRKDAKKSEKAGEEKLGGLAFVPSFRHGLPESSLQGCKTLRYGNIGYCSARYSLIKISLNPGIALHGFWIPAIPAGMTGVIANPKQRVIPAGKRVSSATDGKR